MKKTILILLALMLSTSLFSQKERYEKDVLRMYDDCKIYSVTEDYSIALAFIPGTAGGSSRYELRVISDEDFSRGVSVGSVGSKEYRYLGKTSGVDVYYGDFTFDGIPDIARIQDTELFLRV